MLHNKTKVLRTLLITSLGLVFTILLFSPQKHNTLPVIKIQAQDATCPSNYTLQQCYEYVQKQLQDLNKKQGSLNSKLKALSGQQQNAYNKLLVTQTKISKLQIDIKKIELSMLSTQLNIQSLENLIKETQQDISNQNHDLQQRKNKIIDLIHFKYVVSAFPWYFYTKSGDIQSLIEYLSIVSYMLTEQKSEIKYLELLQDQIKQKEEALAQKQKDLNKKQLQLEKETKELNNTKKELESQKAEQQRMLAQIANMEAQIRKEINNVKKKSNQYNEQLKSIINQLGDQAPPNGTYVAKGSVIGYQGHTGCAYGSHLHFALLKWTGSSWVYVNPVSEGLLGCSGSCSPNHYMVSKTALSPLPSAMITQNYWSGHHAYDLVSMSAGNQLGTRYCVNKGDIKCSPNTAGCFGLRGEGAPILAIYSGTFYGPKVDWWGGKYVFIIHNINGKKYLSLYVHLR